MNNKQRTPVQERRYLSASQAGGFEIRKSADGSQKIVGYAAKFDRLSDDLGSFREKIDPHAFDACLAANPDVRALFNHDANLILGRTTAGTLRLSVDSIGVKYEIDPPNTSFAKDLMISMERGDVTQSSFGFVCVDDTWSEDINGNITRTVLKATLFDVSPVTYPAYPDATSGVRASLRSAPAAIRAKLKRDDDDESGCEDDPDCDGSEEDLEDDSDCDCRCQPCEDGYCERCSNPDCEDDACYRCAMQTRAAHLELLKRRLR